MPADPARVAPNLYKVLLDNDRVRVLEIRARAAVKTPMHSHPASVVYMVRDFKATFTFPDGQSHVVEAKAGQTMWLDAQEHVVETVAGTETHVIMVEMK